MAGCSHAKMRRREGGRNGSSRLVFFASLRLERSGRESHITLNPALPKLLTEFTELTEWGKKNLGGAQTILVLPERICSHTKTRRREGGRNGSSRLVTSPTC